MRAVRYTVNGGEPRLGRLEDAHIVDAGPAGPHGFVPTPEAWEALAAADGAHRDIHAVQVLAPVVPQSLVCIGINYRSHAHESKHPVPAAPIVFAKLPSATIGPGAQIVLPYDEPQPDYEAEMALVIGARVRRADRAQARAAIGGITAFNDVSGRHAQLGPESGGQWTRGKSYDTFGPLGPAILCATDVDLGDLTFAASCPARNCRVPTHAISSLTPRRS